jgi:hypothetical protein
MFLGLRISPEYSVLNDLKQKPGINSTNVQHLWEDPYPLPEFNNALSPGTGKYQVVCVQAGVSGKRGSATINTGLESDRTLPEKFAID